MFQVRYVSGGLLFLKPLGTFLTMRRSRRNVNRFSVCKLSFHQVLSLYVSVVYTEPQCITCG